MERDSLLLNSRLTQIELKELLDQEGYRVAKLGPALEVEFQDFSIFIYFGDFEEGTGLYFNLAPRGLGHLKMLNPWYRKVALTAAGAYKEELVRKLEENLVNEKS